jgi:hypothetical protein
MTIRCGLPARRDVPILSVRGEVSIATSNHGLRVRWLRPASPSSIVGAVGSLSMGWRVRKVSPSLSSLVTLDRALGHPPPSCEPAMHCDEQFWSKHIVRGPSALAHGPSILLKQPVMQLKSEH